MFGCQVGPFRRRQKTPAPAVSGDLAPKKKAAFIIRNSSDEDIAVSAHHGMATHGARKHASTTVETANLAASLKCLLKCPAINNSSQDTSRYPQRQQQL